MINLAKHSVTGTIMVELVNALTGEVRCITCWIVLVVTRIGIIATQKGERAYTILEVASLGIQKGEAIGVVVHELHVKLGINVGPSGLGSCGKQLRGGCFAHLRKTLNDSVESKRSGGIHNSSNESEFVKAAPLTLLLHGLKQAQEFEKDSRIVAFSHLNSLALEEITTAAVAKEARDLVGTNDRRCNGSETKRHGKE